MSDILNALNIGTEIEHDGKRYAVTQMTFEQQGRFSLWVEQNALAFLNRSRTMMKPDEYREALGQLTRDVAAQRYEFGSPACLAALQTPRGAQYALYLVLNGNDRSVTEELAAAIFTAKCEEVAAAITRANGVDPQKGPPTPPSSAPSSDSDTSVPSSATPPTT